MLLGTIRNWQYTQMQHMIQSLKSLLAIVDPALTTTYRDGGDGWTVLEVLCHLRDFEAIFLDRAKLTLEQDFPDLPFPDPDELAAERRYNEQDLQQVIDDWQAHRQEFIGVLEKIDEDDWERAANHPKRGRFTLHDQLFLTTWHDVLHLEQITRILSEKQ